MNTLQEKKRVFVDMDNVLVDFESGLAQVNEDVKKEYVGRLDEIPGLFGLMKPMPGAIEAMHELQKHYDLFILSTAPWKNPSAWSDKVKWVQRYFDSAKKEGVFYKRLILCHHKNMLIRPGAYLIDDRSKNGAEQFGDHWIQFGKEPFLTWESVVNYLM
jgi:5'(3')-deoxyribonucleotidase